MEPKTGPGFRSVTAGIRPWENAVKARGGVIVAEIARANYQALSRWIVGWLRQAWRKCFWLDVCTHLWYYVESLCILHIVPPMI
jgi:hypothetical protein